MTQPNTIEFVRSWQDWREVHQFAIEMEWTNATDFPLQLQKPLEALHMAFLTADERDDPQFRMDRSEIQKLVDDLDRQSLR